MITSAGILLYRNNKDTEVFLVHPGGPFWAKKEEGSWSIPKGEFTDEEPESAAIREFEEETGFKISGRLIPLTPVKLKGGKVIFAFSMEGNVDSDKIKSNHFTIEWPPGSGRMNDFPEVDRAGWFNYNEAVSKINAGQKPLLDELFKRLKSTR